MRTSSDVRFFIVVTCAVIVLLQVFWLREARRSFRLQTSQGIVSRRSAVTVRVPEGQAGNPTGIELPEQHIPSWAATDERPAGNLPKLPSWKGETTELGGENDRSAVATVYDCHAVKIIAGLLYRLTRCTPLPAPDTPTYRFGDSGLAMGSKGARFRRFLLFLGSGQR